MRTMPRRRRMVSRLYPGDSSLMSCGLGRSYDGISTLSVSWQCLVHFFTPLIFIQRHGNCLFPLLFRISLYLWKELITKSRFLHWWRNRRRNSKHSKNMKEEDIDTNDIPEVDFSNAQNYYELQDSDKTKYSEWFKEYSALWKQVHAMQIRWFRKGLDKLTSVFGDELSGSVLDNRLLNRYWLFFVFILANECTECAWVSFLRR